MQSTIILYMGALFILVGLATAVFFVWRIVRAQRSRRWPRVPGELESADLRRVIYEGEEVGGGSDNASAMVVDFRYRYTVDGRTYLGRRVTFSDNISKPLRTLEKLQRQYRDRGQVTVHYNPKNPADSVLIPGAGLFNFTPLITSSLFVAAGLYLLQLDR
ncbi:MAG TPA: DUF3592 domain-containing protein [Thiotrichales bacterium]|nr:DUF3592 domain-containing protein [Thiotrichales bacterium]